VQVSRAEGMACGGVAPVQRLMGQSSVATTVGYDRRPEAATRKAAVLVGVPYASPLPR